jgi:hypothetical protein
VVASGRPLFGRPAGDEDYDTICVVLDLEIRAAFEALPTGVAVVRTRRVVSVGELIAVNPKHVVQVVWSRAP